MPLSIPGMRLGFCCSVGQDSWRQAFSGLADEQLQTDQIRRPNMNFLSAVLLTAAVLQAGTSRLTVLAKDGMQLHDLAGETQGRQADSQGLQAAPASQPSLRPSTS